MIILKNNWWVPEIDTHCFQAVLKEVEAVDELANLCKTKRVCIQAGGNLGIWPKKLSTIFDSVYTFEPDLENWQALEKNLVGINNIHAKNCALGAIPGKVSIDRLKPNNVGAHQVKDGADTERITIDSLNLSEVSLIQLDVEGSEHDAILGAKATLLRSNPIVVLELKGLGKRYGHSDANTVKLLGELGFSHIKTIKRDWVNFLDI
jgi:FkbM family methyltransferase